MVSFECTGVLTEEIQTQIFEPSAKIIVRESDIFLKEYFISYSYWQSVQNLTVEVTELKHKLQSWQVS